jgi:hypothetical protein
VVEYLRVTVVYTFTALNESGNEYVRAMDEAHYRGWATAIEASLRGDAEGHRESTT